jgi:hypothetical protein
VIPTALSLEMFTDESLHSSGLHAQYTAHPPKVEQFRPPESVSSQKQTASSKYFQHLRKRTIFEEKQEIPEFRTERFVVTRLRQVKIIQRRKNNRGHFLNFPAAALENMTGW